jgi:hypothetical protein
MLPASPQVYSSGGTERRHWVGALLAGWLLMNSAWAQAPVDDPTIAAAEASQVRDQYCTDASNDAITLEAEGTARVSAVWARVSRSYDANKTVYLLYWRALLGQCIDKVERVQEDLESFLAAVGDDPAYGEQVRDARRRLQRLAVQVQAEQQIVDPRPAIGIGLGLVGGGAVLGALSGWQGARMAELSASWHSGDLLTDGYQGVEDEASRAEATSNGLLAAAVATGGAGVIAAVVGAGVAAEQAQVAASIVPTRGGIAVAIGGRW